MAGHCAPSLNSLSSLTVTATRDAHGGHCPTPTESSMASAAAAATTAPSWSWTAATATATATASAAWTRIADAARRATSASDDSNYYIPKRDENDATIRANKHRGPDMTVLKHGQRESCCGASFAIVERDGTSCVWTCEDDAAVLWDAKTNTPMRTLRFESSYDFATFCVDANLLAAITIDHTEIHLIQLDTGSIVSKIVPNDFVGEGGLRVSGVGNIMLSADGSRAITASPLFANESYVCVYDVRETKLLLRCRVFMSTEASAPQYHAATISRSGFLIAFAHFSDHVIVGNIDKDEAIEITPENAHGNSFVSSLVFTPDDEVLLSALADRTVRMWSTTNGALLRVLTTGHPTRVLSMDLSLDGRFLLTGGNDCSARVRDLATEDAPPTHVIEVRRPVTFVGFSRDGYRVLAGCLDYVMVPRSGAFAHAVRVTLALLGRSPPARGSWLALPFAGSSPPPPLVKRFVLDKDGDHAIWSRVLGFLVWSSVFA